MASTGKVSAASVAANLRTSFQNIKLALLVGICGGVPYGSNHKQEIFLGDVVISQSLIQYDFGKQYPSGFVRKASVEDSLHRAPLEIRSPLAKLETPYHRLRTQDNLSMLLYELQGQRQQAVYPGMKSDRLFEPS